MKTYKNIIFSGTITLIIAGLLTRVLGFYYIIFLSSNIGAEGIGLYQMILPIYILCMSISSSGIQLAICQQVSKDDSKANSTLLSGLLIALPISLICSLILIFGGKYIAVFYLHEPRCRNLLVILGLCVPVATIHNCINGYFLGKQNAFIPGITQFAEQLGRIIMVFITFSFFSHIIPKNVTTLSTIAVLGILSGEILSTIISIMSLFYSKNKLTFAHKISLKNRNSNLLHLATPVTLTNVSLSIIHSIEATAIPFFLLKSGLSRINAVSTYGILTAMAMPFIMFPSTITCAVAKMLLPVIAKAKSKNNYERISLLTSNTLKYCTILGILCSAFFIIFGKLIGNFFFNSPEAGEFITILAWLCPFIFISSTLGSILNGLGFTKKTFIHNIISAFIRLIFIIIFIPNLGIKGYLWGLLASELTCALLHTTSVVKHLST
jgi:stage V sporulation protein B